MLTFIFVSTRTILRQLFNTYICVQPRCPNICAGSVVCPNRDLPMVNSLAVVTSGKNVSCSRSNLSTNVGWFSPPTKKMLPFIFTMAPKPRSIFNWPAVSRSSSVLTLKIVGWRRLPAIRISGLSSSL